MYEVLNFQGCDVDRVEASPALTGGAWSTQRCIKRAGDQEILGSGASPPTVRLLGV